MKKSAKGIGLAIVGAGRVGLFRGEVAARHPAVEWIGIAELNPNRGGDVAARIGADFVTTDHRELLRRPEVTCALIATDEHLHVAPIMAAVERGVPMLIEKPLATDLAESARVLKAVTHAKTDGSVYHLNISWALPVTWPGAVYSLEVGINGTHGVLTIDDTHRDMVLAVTKPQEEGYNPDRSRLVDFMGSYPPGDMALGELRGPMREETDSWLNRVSLGLPTQAATAAEAHRNLMLTKALDLSARRKQPVKLPLEPEEERAAA